MRQALMLLLVMPLAGCARTVMFESPTAPTTAANLLHEFSSTILPGGSASRTFDATTGGAISVVLTSTTPAGVPVGLGVGIPRANGSCALQAAVEGAVSAHISINAEKGPYCAKVYDTGALQDALPFTISISYP